MASLIKDRRAVGTFLNYTAAHNALQELSAQGFDMNRVSLVGRDVNGNTETVTGTDIDPTGNSTVDNRGLKTVDLPGTRLVDEQSPRQVAKATSTVGGAPLGNDETLAVHQDEAEEGAKTGALTGGALGGLTGLLVGLGALTIPGIGPVMLAGAAATAIATTLSGTAIGAAAGSLVGGLIGLGIPEKDAAVYNDRVSQGRYLVIIEGTDQEIQMAGSILKRHGIEEWNVYDQV